MRKLAYVSATGNFIVHAEHIPGVKNTKADALSRFQMQKFQHLAPRADRGGQHYVKHQQI